MATFEITDIAIYFGENRTRADVSISDDWKNDAIAQVCYLRALWGDSVVSDMVVIESLIVWGMYGDDDDYDSDCTPYTVGVDENGVTYLLSDDNKKIYYTGDPETV